jgi:NAD(P)-dependent dehydrogenase (short-subunit alcohol dehydrogenase family)
MKAEHGARTLVIGAGSAIAQALIARLLQDPTADIVAVSRNTDGNSSPPDPRIKTIRCHYSATAISATAVALKDYTGSFDRVFICTGLLHNERITPEKRVEEIDAGPMAELFWVNSILPALWLKELLPVLKSSPRCIFTLFSARVGSIADNKKGGWYSYRASKAALNMLIKTAAVEYARRAPGVKLLAFHPGTVDTELSRPFQKNVPSEKLFTPQFVAEKLIELTDILVPDGSASYLDWAGESIDW